MTAEQTVVALAGAFKTGAPDFPVDSDSGQVATRCFEVVFLPADFRAGQMRRITSAHLRLWDLLGLCDAATLAVSELLTNAVRHGEGNPVGLRVTGSDEELRIEVTDGSPSPARLLLRIALSSTGQAGVRYPSASTHLRARASLLAP
ncbi:ATP-binding protein [Streptomyces sp. NPDC051243]|uniref:ATP-binding protein n=1 Tax=Streptomyces sp. NPDC051243 TaxID=3365646 RepID=UPI00379B62B4